MDTLKKTIWYDTNSEPPKNYIWIKADGKAYEYNNSTRSWELSKTMSSASNGGGNGTDSNASHVYEVSSLEDIQNPKEGDIAIISDSWGELTIEPTVTEDNGTITKIYNVESYSANSRIRVTSDPTCFASSYVDSENNSHNSGSVSTNVFPVGTKSITLWETGEFPEVYFYEEVPGATKEYVNGEWVDRANFSSAIENMSSEEKMQVRKNLGLYYEETGIVEKTVVCEETEWSQARPPYIKISDDIPSETDILGLYLSDDDTLRSFTIRSLDDYGCFFIEDTESLSSPFRVVVDAEAASTETGIYYDSNAIGTNNYRLKYRNEVTTVSKIDAKFLPEQESGMPTITLKAIPQQTAYNININDYLSNEDLQKLLSCESALAVYQNGSGNYTAKITFIVTIAHYFPSTYIYDQLHFEGLDNNNDAMPKKSKFSFDIVNRDVDGWYIEVPENKPLYYYLSQLPTAQMTTQELAEIGLDNHLFERIQERNCVGVEGGWGNCLPFIWANYSGCEFWSATDKYVLSYDSMIRTVTVTVTPR